MADRIGARTSQKRVGSDADGLRGVRFLVGVFNSFRNELDVVGSSLKLLFAIFVLERLSTLVQQSRHAETELVLHIGEVDRRKLYAREATPSMFVYCTEVLHLSEHAAYRRIAVARAARRHPVLLEMLHDGRMHLSGIALLAPHLNKLDDARRDALLAEATHKTKRQIDELIAAIAPKPDVATTIRKLPQRAQLATSENRASSRFPERVGMMDSESTSELTDPAAHAESAASPAPMPAPQPAKVEALAQARYKVTFTAGAELHEKLERLRALTPNSDLVTLIEEAISEKLERVEARRLGKTNKPRKTLATTDMSPGSRYIPAAVKRAVASRDGEQCTFVNAAGKRCSERGRLEFHHDEPYALGGDRSPANIRQLCATHNAYFAELTYGKNAMQHHRPPQASASGSNAKPSAPSG